jgi:hypothetical protein
MLRTEHGLIRRRVLDKAHKLAMEGTPKQAKYASRFLAFTRKDDRCSDLVDVSLITVIELMSRTSALN